MTNHVVLSKFPHLIGRGGGWQVPKVMLVTDSCQLGGNYNNFNNQHRDTGGVFGDLACYFQQDAVNTFHNSNNNNNKYLEIPPTTPKSFTDYTLEKEF